MAPWMASKVLRIRCSRAWTSTWMVTSSGMWPPSMSSRQISYSVSLAEGKPISISLTPMSTRVWKYSSFSSRFMGSTRAWLPSRRSTEHQTGAWVMTLVRPGAALDGLGLEGDVLLISGFHNASCLLYDWLRGGQKTTPPTFSSQGRRITDAVPPWFGRRLPESGPHKPPTRLRPVTGPYVPSYCTDSDRLLGDQYPQWGRTPVPTNHRLSEGG